MRDIYPRQLSEKSLVANVLSDGDGGDDARTDITCTAMTRSTRAPPAALDRPRRTSMSNSMTFFRGNSISSSLSSLFGHDDEIRNEKPDGSAAALERSSSAPSAAPTFSSSNLHVLSFPSLINRGLTNIVKSMFQCKADENDLVSSKHGINTSRTKSKLRTSLMDQVHAEDSEEVATTTSTEVQEATKNSSDPSSYLTSPGNGHLDLGNHNNLCLLCLNDMSPTDLFHPPQCGTSKCNFNFCLDCAESYIASSKDPYQKASDGSHQLKIFLRCPCCRSDLSTSIRDTVLLRHAAIVEKETDEIQRTPSDLSLQHAMSSDPYIQAALVVAKEREAIFLRDGATSRDDLPFGPASPTKKLFKDPSDMDGFTTSKQNRRHSFFYGLIEEAKQAREKKARREVRRGTRRHGHSSNRRQEHSRRHSVA